MSKALLEQITRQIIQESKAAGTYKSERIITSKQGTAITVKDNTVLNFCANNYLGLSSHPKVVERSQQYLLKYGAGLSSVRFICGTQSIHKELENTITKFHGTSDTILYPSCFDANAGLFEAILSQEDAIISDELNHASIIDGVRLCKAKRFRYKHADMASLEQCLKEAFNAGSRLKLIATDGVFSMDGDLAPLDKICDLADKYGALVFVDDCHATGFLGKNGKGTPELFNVEKRVDIVNSTLGKALGGASGGYTTSLCQGVIDVLRQKARPYLFSNSIPPAVVGSAAAALDIVQSEEGAKLRKKLFQNVELFRSEMKKAGFKLQGNQAIVPVMLGNAKLASEFADKMLQKGVYVIGFSYPVVPKEKARIRVQLSAAHSTEEVKRAIDAFISVGKELNIALIMQGNEIVAIYPPPPKYYKQFIDSSEANEPPEIPENEYSSFGMLLTSSDDTKPPTLKEAGVNQLFDSSVLHREKSKECLHGLLDSLMMNYFELLEMITKNLSSPELIHKKIEDLNVILLNMFYLINSFREAQGRMSLSEFLQAQTQFRKDLIEQGRQVITECKQALVTQ